MDTRLRDRVGGGLESVEHEAVAAKEQSVRGRRSSAGSTWSSHSPGGRVCSLGHLLLPETEVIALPYGRIRLTGPSRAIRLKAE